MERQEKASKGLKERFIKELVLVAPDLDKKMRIEVDALDYITREVLSMECKNERWRPVAYLLKSLNEMERNYEIHDKEMLVVILLKSTKFKFEVWMDHKNLEYFMKA